MAAKTNLRFDPPGRGMDIYGGGRLGCRGHVSQQQTCGEHGDHGAENGTAHGILATNFPNNH